MLRPLRVAKFSTELAYGRSLITPDQRVRFCRCEPLSEYGVPGEVEAGEDACEGSKCMLFGRLSVFSFVVVFFVGKLLSREYLYR